MKKEVIIIGAGASGILSAILIKREKPDCKVTIIEKENKIAKKILASGNGKCNLSNLNLDVDNYNQIDFLKEKLNEFDYKKLKDIFLSIGLIIKTDKESRAYPYSESSKTVVDVLQYNLDKLDIKVLLETEIIKIEKNVRFELYSKEEKFETDYLIMAVGGMAAVNNFNGYKLLKEFNHNYKEPMPSLVGLITYEDVKRLKGVRVKSRVYANGLEEDGEVQFRENGISGIVVMNLSRAIKENDFVCLDLMPDYSVSALENMFNGKDTLKVLEGIFVKELANYIYSLGKNINQVISNIKKLSFKVKAKDSFKNAQVTKGGIIINEIDDSFESKNVKGLYILGETLDVDGICGGYNLHFAWLSSYFASLDLIKKL
ncbi:MAG: aminoacetone oxidase family FAD-binding enzyme [Bacilli bacterium]|nr:aminoacetone oxidase family FAD-binding enzyme [Bacilli bacterium]